ncbi:hypothetical protein LTR38_012182 [Friedmanniomyces endolithicus]|nr:hypothetical protein LTR38_012182 [Friedmanniomyces endolithicus]
MDNDILSSPEYASRREEYKKRFYIPVLELSESTKELLVEYSKIPEGTQVYLDLGCAFAQNLRRLVFDGVPSAQCYGADLRLEFLDLGYELFADRATLESKFIAADVFDEESGLRELDGKVDIVDASSFFHLFTLAEQKKVARRVLGLLKPRAGGEFAARGVRDEEWGGDAVQA